MGAVEASALDEGEGAGSAEGAGGVGGASQTGSSWMWRMP